MKWQPKLLSLAATMLLTTTVIAAEQTTPTNYTGNFQAFMVLSIIGVILLIGILIMGFAIRSFATSSFFAKAMKKKTGAKVITVLLCLSVPSLAGAAESWNDSWFAFSDQEIYLLALIDFILLLIFFYLKNILAGLLARVNPEPKAVAQEDKVKRISAMLTDIVPLEEEEFILFDHEYDGIRELDNNLPPWWKWGFYLSIFFAFAYLLHYHVLGTGELQVAEYERSVEEAQIELDAYLKSQALNVDETTVITLFDDGSLGAGKSLFMQYCKLCHGAGGEGGVGPNLTDDYWYYGNEIWDVFSTIKYGSDKGTMKSWKDELNPLQIQQVASYIQSLYGTNPDNPKDPEGDYYEPVSFEEVSDATLTETPDLILPLDSLVMDTTVAQQ